MPKEIRVTITDLCASCSASCDTVPHQLLLSPCQSSGLLCGDELAQHESGTWLCGRKSPPQTHTAVCTLFTFPKAVNAGALGSPLLSNHYVISHQSKSLFLSCSPLRRCMKSGWRLKELYIVFFSFFHCINYVFSVHISVAQCPKWLWCITVKILDCNLSLAHFQCYFTRSAQYIVSASTLQCAHVQWPHCWACDVKRKTCKVLIFLQLQHKKGVAGMCAWNQKWRCGRGLNRLW